jgi:adenylate kinase family enzyme
MRVLISGGPGSGCTSTALEVGERLKIPVFDSDTYFHKPSDPPFQEQYDSDERRRLLAGVLTPHDFWILSGSVATWGVNDLRPTHAVFLQIPTAERMKRLEKRQRERFGSRIDPGGDMEEEHRSFMAWASEYENRSGHGRNLATDLAFLEASGGDYVRHAEVGPFEKVVARIVGFLTKVR